MSDDHLYDLVIEWDRRRQLGTQVAPETLCADQPELLDALRERIASVQETDWLFADEEDTDDSFLTLPDFAALDGNGEDVALPASDLSLDEFTKALTGSGLLSAKDVTACQELNTPADAPALARDLIRRQKLTPWQASVLLGRKSDPLVLDRYVILDRIDAGGMGQVFKALHRSMKRVVALKILPPGAVDSPDKVQRFQREVEAAAQLSHPNVVTAHDAHEAGGVFFLVMEYVDGRNLRNLVREDGRLPVRRAVEIIQQAARGLAYAHNQGVIHRDIKPSNLMLTFSRDPQGSESPAPTTLKILDMGLARFDAPAEEDDQTVTNELTQSGAVMGTPAYMAPEQAADTHAADARSDVYSLGCTLYYLLHGNAPYAEDTGVKLIIAHREQPIPILNEGRYDVPAELCDVYQRMMAKQPEDRLQSMDEVVAALEAINLPEDPSETVVLSESELEPAGGTPSSEADGRGDDADHALPDVRACHPDAPPRSGKWGWSIAAAALFLAVLSGIIIQINTRAGTLYIEVEGHPDAVVKIDGETAVVDLQDDGRTLKLSVDPGTYDLVVETPDGFVLRTDAANGKVTIDAGGDQRVTAWLEPPVNVGDGTNYALLFDGEDDWVHFPSLELPSDEPFTVELTIRCGSDEGGYVWSQVGNATRLQVHEQRMILSVGDSESNRHLINPWFNPFPEYFHVAAVFDGSGIRLFVNGVPDDETINVSDLYSRPGSTTSTGIVLGTILAPSRDEPDFVAVHQYSGKIDEVRISSIARYTGDFTPEERFESDEDTLALYHFDEGEGEVLVDSSGNGHHGTIHGATWVRARSAIDYARERQMAQRLLGLGARLTLLTDPDDYDSNFTVNAGEELPDGTFWIGAIRFPDHSTLNATDLTGIESLRYLSYFNAMYCSVDDSAALLLSQNNSLRIVYLAGADVGNDGLAAVSALPALRTLSIGTRVTDAGLAHLRGAELQVLDLNGCAGVTDAAIDDILTLPALKTIYLPETSVTAAGVARLLTAKPNLHVIHESISDSAARNFALQFDGVDDWVHIPSLELPVGKPFTVETWVAHEPDEFGMFVSHPGGGVHLKAATQAIHGSLRIGPTNPPEIRSFLAPFPGRIHVAYIFDGRELRLFVNGIRNPEALASEGRPESSPFDGQVRGFVLGGHLAANPNAGWNPEQAYQGVIDEVRFSSVARYTDDFTPEERFEPDEHTLALYHFDEGEGDVLVDSSGNEHHGEIHGARWVKVVEPGTYVPYDADRRAAEWVLEQGGNVMVKVSGDESWTHQRLHTLEELPIAAFELHNVFVNDLAIGDKHLASIAPLMRELRLHELDLGGTSITDSGLRHLAGTVIAGLKLSATQIDGSGLQFLSEIDGLRSLYLNRTAVTADALATLSGVPELRTLQLIWTDVTDEELQAVSTLSSLRALEIDSREFTDRGVDSLTSLSELETLRIAGAGVTNASIRHLRNLERLRRLNLRSTSVTDEAIPELAEFSNLNELNLHNSNVTAEGVARLQEALPDCQIIHESISDPDREVAEWVLSAGGEVSLLVGPNNSYEVLNGDESLPDERFRVSGVRLDLTDRNAVAREFFTLPLSDLSELRHAYLSGAAITDVELEQLSMLTSLHAILLTGAAITDDGLAALNQLPALYSLSLIACDVSDAGVRHLAEIPTLTHLYLSACSGVTDGSVDDLAKLGGLRILGLAKTNMSAEGVQRLHEALPDCRIVSDFGTFGPVDPDRLVAQWVMERGGKAAIWLPSGDVQYLHGGDEIPVSDFQIGGIDLFEIPPDGETPISNLERLSNLAWTHAGVDDAAILQLSNLPSLRRVTLQYSEVSDAAIEHLAGFATLESLEIGSPHVTDAGMAHLLRLPNLRELDLECRQLANAGLETIGGIDQLESLTIDNMPQVTDEGLAHIANLQHLAQLTIESYMDVTWEGIGQLSALPALESLTIQGARPGDMSVLGQFGGLTTLGLRRMEFEAPEHLQLPVLPNLKQLELGHSQINDAFIEMVADVYPGLESIGLKETPVSDACVPALSRLEGLRELTLTGTEITADGLARLQEALPDCRIIHESIAADMGAHRAVAEWVFAHGGQVDLGDANDFRWQSEQLSTVAELPAERDWRIKSIHLGSLSEIRDDDVAELAGLLPGIRVEYFDLGATGISDTAITHLAGTEIGKLHIGGTSVSDAGIAGLAAIRSLNHVVLNGTQVTDAGVHTLAELGDLDILFLGKTGITDGCLADIARLSALTWLDVSRTAVTDAGVQSLQANRNLSVLNLAETGITDQSLSHLALLPNLRSLQLNGCDVTDGGLERLAEMQSLETLILSHTSITDAGVEHLAKLSRLTDLSLMRTDVTADGVTGLQEALPNCRIVHESIPESDRDRAAAEWVLSVGGRVGFVTGGNSRQVDNAADVPDSPFSVNYIELHDCAAADDESLRRLNGLEHLAHLNLTLTPVTDDGLAHLSELPALTSLLLAGTNVTSAGLEQVKRFFTLTTLHLHETRVDGAGMSDVAELSELEWLSLNFTEVTDAGLESIAGLKKLSSLHLIGVPVTDEGLERLAEMQSLETLRLSGTSITDAGLEHLHGLENLTKLELMHTEVTASGVARLREALPDCDVLWNDNVDSNELESVPRADIPRPDAQSQRF